MLWKIFWDINLAVDFAYESRHYANLQIKRANPKRPAINVQRDDSGILWGVDLSKQFFIDSRLISLFDSFTPSFDMQSTNFTSSISQFGYKDFTTSLTFEFGF